MGRMVMRRLAIGRLGPGRRSAVALVVVLAVALAAALAGAVPAAATPQEMAVGGAMEEPDGETSPTPRPDSIRGIYLNAWLAGSSIRVGAALDLIRRTELNTVVIDVKDATGHVSYATDVPMARAIGADQEIRIRDLPSLLDRLAAEGVYTIARIVVFKDPLLASKQPEMAVQDSTGATWIDGKGDRWVNPYDLQVWAYHVELAREAIALGFGEIQWDYVRFPDRPASEMSKARFPGSETASRARVIGAFLDHGRAALAELDVPVTADVFGVSTTVRSDVGIGQLWEEMLDGADALLPMVYPSHYWPGSYGFEVPNAQPYEIVRRALEDAIARTRDAGQTSTEIIPWLQDFTLGDPPYGAAEVRAQILAVTDLGLPHWLLWNAAGRYTEGALRPAAGWGPEGEPMIRFGGRIVPATDRFGSTAIER